MTSKGDFLFRGDLSTLDPQVLGLIELEKERQARKLIMIPSESSSPRAVREALGSVLAHVYAEGYPHPDTRDLTESEILDYDRSLAHFRRYGDRRYYRGVEFADLFEALARRRCAEAFATRQVPPDEILVNVQPLSGAPANTAVMQALLDPGDTIMGLALDHGGHLTHGSAVNLSGKTYKVVPYKVNAETEKLDYDEIEALAVEGKPKLIIAGYTSYPFQPDWARLRQIADRVGAYLMADIAHVAGMVIGEVYASPVGYADAITFTTHKTLCGPRGACILCTDRKLAGRIDRAVFPGLQGGPHVNKFAAMAVAFRLAQTQQFRELQIQIVSNAKALADALSKRGLRLPCGGTDTHLLLVDCKSVKSADGTPLMGDPTATILDLLGIVVNKNTIPGDTSARSPSGIRIGTPWVTQRGLREPEMDRIADIIVRAMNATVPFKYDRVGKPAYKGKIDFDTFEELRDEVASLASDAGIDFEFSPNHIPHHYRAQPVDQRDGHHVVEIEGTVAHAFVDQITPADIQDVGEWSYAPLLDASGKKLSPAVVRESGPEGTAFRLVVPADRARRVVSWLRDLSDGYVLSDRGDPRAKLPGPVVVRDLGLFGQDAADLGLLEQVDAAIPAGDKPYFIGLSGEEFEDTPGEALAPFEWNPGERPLHRTPLFEWHKAHNARLAPFAGWEMPLWYTSIGDEHKAVRHSAGLFDVAHMGMLEVAGPHAAEFLNLVATNDVYTLRRGQSQYAYLLSPDGRVIDDIMIYQTGPSRYIVVVNASNAEKDWAWLNAVNERAVRIDDGRPWARTGFQASLRDLADESSGSDRLVDMALQGPRSLDVLMSLLDKMPDRDMSKTLRAQLLSLGRTRIMEAHIPALSATGDSPRSYIARTGYTGEPLSYELFVHPDALESLWSTLLEVGVPLGLQPVGLGARDSLRIEAGLPLYGHELAGPLDLRPDDAGFAGYVKMYKPFFVGRQAYAVHAGDRKMILARFKVEEKGVRIPKQGDAVADGRGRLVGRITSCALDTDGFLVGQAFVNQRYAKQNTRLNIFPHPGRAQWGKPYEQLESGDQLVLPVQAKVVARFFKKR